MTINSPSRDRWTSSSTCSTPSVVACLKDASEFSGYLLPPRCATICGNAMIVALLFEAEIGAVAKPVTDGADRERQNEDCDARDGRDPPGRHDVVPSEPD